MNSLVKNILDFLEVLRLSGMSISLSEILDVVQSLQYVNLSEREEVKYAMAACLAKSEENRMVYFKAFDSFFLPPDVRSERTREKMQAVEKRRQKIEESVSELKFQGEQITLTNDHKELYDSLTDEEKKSILDFLNRTSTGKNVRSEFRPIVENIIHSKLDRIKQTKLNPECATGTFDELLSEAGLIAGEVVDAVKAENSLQNKNISQITEEEIPRAIRIIIAYAEQLKRHIARKYKKTNKKSDLDFRKTIRGNLNNGGVLFKLKYKARKRRKDRLIMMCDVSASMYKFSGFVLQFLHGVHSITASMEAFIFSEEIGRLNLAQFDSFSNFEQQIKHSSVWRKGTNIHKVFTEVLKGREVSFNSSSILLIVSDAKTLEVDQTIERLKTLKTRVKNIIWLNPIQESDWKRIPGIEEFTNYCTMIDCSTLDRLSKACGNLSI